jgi:hypothetical protein
MAAIFCSSGRNVVSKVIESGPRRWKAHHYPLMKNKPKRLYPVKS